MELRLSGLACLSAAVLAVASVGSARVVAVEDFGGYIAKEEDASLGGKLVAAGQAAPNTAVSGITSWGADMWNGDGVMAGDLSYPGYASSGGKRMFAASGGLSSWAFLDTSESSVFADFVDQGPSGPEIGKAGTTLYMSFLFSIQGNTTANSQAVIRLQGKNDLGAWTTRLGVGQDWNMPAIRTSGIVLDSFNNDTHLVVLKLQFNGTMTGSDDTVTVWFDPDLSLGESLQTVDATLTTNATFSRIAFIAQGSNNNDLTRLEVDDIRFGTSWADVLPVPEPSIGALAMIASGMVLARRRRCRRS